MARSRTLTEIVDEAYRYADVEGQLLRHPRADVARWANKGLAELWDLLIKAHGSAWGRVSGTITLVAGTGTYSLPALHHELLGVRYQGGGAILPCSQADVAELLSAPSAGLYPRYYMLGQAGITFLPTPGTGTVVVDYVPSFVDLADDSVATFDGVNAWEDYASWYAANRIATKDADAEHVQMASQMMLDLRTRIGTLATRRDAGAPARVKDTYGQRARARAWPR